jgi:hypothetical protein
MPMGTPNTSWHWIHSRYVTPEGGIFPALRCSHVSNDLTIGSLFVGVDGMRSHSSTGSAMVSHTSLR